MPDNYTGEFTLPKELKMRLTKDLNQFTRIINSEYKTELHKEEDQKTTIQNWGADPRITYKDDFDALTSD